MQLWRKLSFILKYQTSFMFKLQVYLRLLAERRREAWEGVWRPCCSWSCEFSSGNIFNGKKIQISFSLSHILFLIQTFPYLQTYDNLLKPKVMSNIVQIYLDYTVEYTEHCTWVHCFCCRSTFYVLNFHKCRMEIWLCLCKANTCSLANGQYLYFITITDIRERHKKCFFSIQPKEN